MIAKDALWQSHEGEMWGHDIGKYVKEFDTTLVSLVHKDLSFGWNFEGVYGVEIGDGWDTWQSSTEMEERGERYDQEDCSALRALTVETVVDLKYFSFEIFLSSFSFLERLGDNDIFKINFLLKGKRKNEAHRRRRYRKRKWCGSY